MGNKRKIAFWGVLCCGILALGFISASAFGQNATPTGNLDSALKDYIQLGGGSKNMISGAMGMPQASELDFAKIVAYILFGGVGFVAFTYGKKIGSWRALAIGIALMGYPYFVSATATIYWIGAILTLMLFLWRD